MARALSAIGSGQSPTAASWPRPSPVTLPNVATSTRCHHHRAIAEHPLLPRGGCAHAPKAAVRSANAEATESNTHAQIWNFTLR